MKRECRVILIQFAIKVFDVLSLLFIFSPSFTHKTAAAAAAAT
jgi:hypothetical protein